jgi:hypothetical protein
MLEDRSVFFADWGEDAVLDGEPVRVLYGAPAAIGLGMSTDKPRALIDADSIPPRTTDPDTEPVLEFVCEQPGRPQRWRVRSIEPDGTGMATLIIVKHEDQG